MSQRYFCPAEYTTKTKPKTNQTAKPNSNSNSKPNLIFCLFCFLVFRLVCTPLGKTIVGSFFWSS